MITASVTSKWPPSVESLPELLQPQALYADWSAKVPTMTRVPRRICSLLPSATEIVAELGLADRLVGVSAECRWPPEVVGKPVVSAARVDTAALASGEIDRLVRELTAEGKSLYAVDAELIDELAPDLIVTQDLCAVCAVSSAELSTACPIDVELLSLDPRTFAEVAESVLTLARSLGAQQRGAQIADEMWEKARAVQRAVSGAARPRVFLAEWIDPPYLGGHWIPEMIELAGGAPVLGRAGEPAYPLSWEEVIAAEPDLVVVAPCGFDAEQAAERAVQSGLKLPCRAVVVDADSYYSRPAPRLADGVCQLGHLLHPDLVPDPGLPAIELAATRVGVADVGVTSTDGTGDSVNGCDVASDEVAGGHSVSA